MPEEWKNKFGRAQKSTLAEDRQTKFDRHDALRAKQRTASDTQADRIERNQKQHANWVGDGRSDIRTASGIKVTPEIQKLKQASDADRASRSEPKAEMPQTSDEDMAALFDRFVKTCPRYVGTKLNAANLLNAMLTNVENGKVSWSVASIRKVFDWLLANGYIETIPQISTRTLADASRPPARVYPAYVSKQRKAMDALNMAIAAQLVDEAEARRALATPFDQLREMVHKETTDLARRRFGAGPRSAG